MTLFNQHDNRVNRACYGLSLFYTVMLNTVLLLGLRDTYSIEWHINPLIVPVFTCALNFYLYFVFKKYFGSRYISIELVHKNKSPRKIIFLGVIFWVGSFLLFGLVGYDYTNKRKVIRQKQLQSVSGVDVKYEIVIGSLF